MSAPPPRSFVKELSLQTGAGATAGFVEICIMHPLDLAKTRLQLQSARAAKASREHHYRNFVDVFRKLVRHEGITALWKGVLPPIMVETPKRAIKFCTFEQYKKIFLFGSPKPTPLTFSLSGLCAGLTEGLLVCPFEVVKVNLQANRDKEPVPMFTVAKDIYSKHGLGLSGLFKGVGPMLIRSGIFNVTLIGAYFSSADYLPVYQEAYKVLGLKIMVGFSAGIVGSSINMPFDVVKSRMQALVSDSTKYKTMLGTFKTIHSEEGLRALYQGYIPKILRLGPGGALLMVTYEYLYEYLKVTFP